MATFNTQQRQALADKGQALPGGGYPIRNRADLRKAILALGRAKNPAAAKRWILKRARELNSMDIIPKDWAGNGGVLKHHNKTKGYTMTDKMMIGMMDEDEFLEHLNAIEDMTDGESIAHFGVKGMHWGQRKSASGGSSSSGAPAKSRKELHALNKQSVRSDKTARNAQIDAARARIQSGQARTDYKNAKAQYKTDKKVIGSREAKKAFTAVKEKNVADYNKSQEAKHGKETVLAVLGSVAGAALMSYVAVNK